VSARGRRRRALGRASPLPGPLRHSACCTRPRSPPTAPLPPPPRTAGGDAAASSGDDTDSAGAFDPAAFAGVPAELQVACNGAPGAYLPAAGRVRCGCAGCGAKAPQLRLLAPADFERHAGVSTARKWRTRCVAGRRRDGGAARSRGLSNTAATAATAIAAAASSLTRPPPRLAPCAPPLPAPRPQHQGQPRRRARRRAWPLA
jgi:hypothetical protein